MIARLWKPVMPANKQQSHFSDINDPNHPLIAFWLNFFCTHLHFHLNFYHFILNFVKKKLIKTHHTIQKEEFLGKEQQPNIRYK